VTTVFEALIHLFKSYGFRDNRNKNRLHFLVESVGMEAFAKALSEQSGLDLTESGELLLTTEHRLGDDGCVELAEGKKALLFAIPSGIFSGTDLIETAELARSTGSLIRLSIEQSFYLINDASEIGLLKASPLYTKYKKFHNVYFTHQIACAGTATCSFGVIPNKPDAIEMAEFLEREMPMDTGKIRMHWSACPKGCGIHGIADIGFEGCKAKDAEGKSCFGVHIFVGGKASFEAQEARQVFKAVPLTEAKAVVKKIVALYINERLEGESFEMYDNRMLRTLSVDQLRDKIMQ